MIGFILGSSLLAGTVFFLLGFVSKRVLWRLGLSVLVWLALLGGGLLLLSRIDNPPAGSRPLTQEELDKAAGINEIGLEKEVPPDGRPE
jgi:hypothetical protein